MPERELPLPTLEFGMALTGIGVSGVLGDLWFHDLTHTLAFPQLLTYPIFDATAVTTLVGSALTYKGVRRIFSPTKPPINPVG